MGTSGERNRRIDIVCSSRELFGADRSAVRLAQVLRTLGWTPAILVPRCRPERGLARLAVSSGIAYEEADIAVASRRGVEGLLTHTRIVDSPSPELTIVNSTAVFSIRRPLGRKIVVVREWLRPRSLRHRVLVFRHRAGAEAVVGVSHGVLQRWRALSRDPRRQFVVPNWLEQSVIDAAVNCEMPAAARGGILFLGRLNRWKGYDLLAEAWEQAFGRERSTPSLTFLGAQPGTEFAAAGDRLAARGQRWGWRVLPFDETPAEHLRSAALVVVPSRHPEPFGVVILEALAHGCRVISFPGGGPDDLAQTFAHALTIVPRSTSSLTHELAKWWHEGGAAQTEDDAELSHQAIAEFYSPAAAAAQWGRIL